MRQAVDPDCDIPSAESTVNPVAQRDRKATIVGLT